MVPRHAARRHIPPCRPSDAPPYPPDGRRGQALIEFALLLPVLLLILLGGGEMAMLFAHYADQDRRTATLAEWAADHPAATVAEWNATVATVGPCANVAVSSPGPDLLAVGMTCPYTPMITSNIWDGLPVSTEAVATIRGAVATATGTPAPSASVTP